VLVAAVTDNIYRDVLAHGYHGLPGSAFTRVDVTVKEFRAVAWLYRPGAAVQPSQIPTEGLMGEEQQTQPALDAFLGTEPDIW
jgi:hypothetical protein